VKAQAAFSHAARSRVVLTEVASLQHTA